MGVIRVVRAFSSLGLNILRWEETETPDEGGGPTGLWGIRRSGPPTLPGVSEVVARAAWSSRRTQGQSWKRGWAFCARAFSVPFPLALFCCEEGARSWAVETGVAPDMGKKASGERWSLATECGR